MRLANPELEHSRAVAHAAAPLIDAVRTTDVTTEDVRLMMLYLRQSRDRAIAIRDRSPGGSYLESVLTRTIDGIALELSQLEFLLACDSEPGARPGVASERRMRPAI